MCSTGPAQVSVPAPLLAKLHGTAEKNICFIYLKIFINLKNIYLPTALFLSPTHMIVHLRAELDLAPQPALGLDMYEAHEEGEERAGHHQGGAQVQHLMVPVTEHVSHNLQERGKMIKSLIIRNNTIDYLLLGLAAVTVQQRDGYKFHGEYGRTWPPPSSCPCSQIQIRSARVLIYKIF